MRYLLPLLILTFSSSFAQKQIGFSGKLVYSVHICDSSLENMIPVRQMTIYTNDSLLRIENNTDQLGQQVVIKHMGLNKSYLLLETPLGKYALQTDHATAKTDTFPYTFKKKWGREKICDKKANKLLVKHSNFDKELEFLYFKDMSPKYINTLENFPGLPVKYYISSIDGTYMYELISIEPMAPDYDLFGIPSDYKKMSFNDFIDEMMKNNVINEEQFEKHE